MSRASGTFPAGNPVKRPMRALPETIK